MIKHTFKREERLKSRKKIEELFKRGSYFYLHPLKIIFLDLESEESEFLSQVLFSVPKRFFKRAVDRNRIKRIMRESYRLNKHRLRRDKPLNIAYIYTGKELPTSQSIADKISQSIDKINSLKM